MGSAEVEDYLTHLALHEHVAASTQNQALTALLLLSTNVLNQPLEGALDGGAGKAAPPS
ncbi:MAG: phage integrase N-terminal SAM-like domain-containing protein [Chloroflexales bacterium]|nr:phage integrase N-terminal SAM-like domain-containing protein [Chloroflexales bacterium]